MPNLSELMEEITTANLGQYRGIEQVNKAVLQMEVIVRQNASSSEENAAAAKELSIQSQSIMDTVQKLSQLISG